MVRIAVAGGNEFVVGFHLAGIKDTIITSNEPFKDLKELRLRKDFGIIIVDEFVMNKLELHERTEIESSVDPVFIPVSTKGEQESLRKLIKKSVGVDLWK